MFVAPNHQIEEPINKMFWEIIGGPMLDSILGKKGYVLLKDF